jgi:Predicted metal-dependent membrane protease
MDPAYDFSSKSIIMPLAVKFGIDILVSFVATIVYMLINIKDFPLETGADFEVIYEFVAGVQQHMVIITLISSICLLPILIPMFQKDNKSIGKVAIKWSMYLFLIVIGITGSIALNNILSLSQIANISTAYQKIVELFFKPAVWLQVLGLGIVIPIAEEVLFRGILFGRLRRVLHRPSAICISALLFGIMHGNLIQFIYAFVMGAIFAYLYDLCGNIKVPICLHIVANLTTIIMTKYEMSKWLFVSFLRVGVITVGFTFVCISFIMLAKEQMLRKC